MYLLGLFPFELPAATTFYVVMYVLVFALHQVLMHYVLGGCCYTAWTALRSEKAGSDNPLGEVVRDWLPFGLSAAITAGVAPLLFIQVLYATPFYTANLLLFWRWMIILPLMIAGFYGLYMIKSSLWQRWSRPARLVLVASVTAAFLVVGVAWSTNHIVSNSQARWAEIYVDGFSSLAADAYLQLVLRVTVWTTAAVASWAVLIRWQLDKAIHASEMLVVPRLLPALAAVAATAAAAVLLLTSDGTSDVSWKPVTFWVVLGAAGLVGQLWSWWGDQQWLLRGSWLAWVLAGSLLREWLRLQTLDVERFQARHADAWQVGGLGVFLAATLLCGALAAWCLHIVRSATSAS